mmetsp:Transcript_1174/g.5197  ORF Transcript_1174/g.5197 Transcript_1174/m.5197 type:complete len:402 (-) Transcript_1174:1904-3109(-)
MIANMNLQYIRNTLQRTVEVQTPELLLVHLAHRVPWDLVDQVERPRSLVFRHVHPRPPRQLRGVHSCALDVLLLQRGHRHADLPVRVVGHAEHGALRDARVRQKHSLRLERAHLEPPGFYYVHGGPPQYPPVPAFLPHGRVPGAEESVWGERARRDARCVPVLFEHGGSPDQQLAGALLFARVHIQPHLYAGQGCTHRPRAPLPVKWVTERHANLCHAVPLQEDDVRPGRFHPGPRDGLRARGGPAHGQAQRPRRRRRRRRRPTPANPPRPIEETRGDTQRMTAVSPRRQSSPPARRRGESTPRAPPSPRRPPPVSEARPINQAWTRPTSAPVHPATRAPRSAWAPRAGAAKERTRAPPRAPRARPARPPRAEGPPPSPPTPAASRAPTPRTTPPRRQRRI